MDGPMAINIVRRKFIAALGGAAFGWPLGAHAQQPDRMRLVGVLMAFAESDPGAQSEVAGFRNELKKLGWMEGNNLRIELRWGAGDANRIKTFAKELVDLRPDAILGQTTSVVSALAHETRTIPIVFAVVSDPIGSGFAASLAHPGGNITGFTTNEPAVGGKWLGLLKEIAPRTVRVALLFNPATAVALRFFSSSIQDAASSSAVQATAAPFHAKDDIEGVIAAQARNPGGGLVVLPDAFFFDAPNRDLVIALAARHSVPTIYFTRLFVVEGGLISYSADFAEEVRQSAGYVDRILKGAKPADLPIQLPINYEMAINLKTATSLGLDIPPTLLARADEVIE
jgi:putative tryptophan/tyrosine transport system substrate-binding protein